MSIVAIKRKYALKKPSSKNFAQGFRASTMHNKPPVEAPNAFSVSSGMNGQSPFQRMSAFCACGMLPESIYKASQGSLSENAAKSSGKSGLSCSGYLRRNALSVELRQPPDTTSFSCSTVGQTSQRTSVDYVTPVTKTFTLG